jgi:hypothetical protein
MPRCDPGSIWFEVLRIRVTALGRLSDEQLSKVRAAITDILGIRAVKRP